MGILMCGNAFKDSHLPHPIRHFHLMQTPLAHTVIEAARVPNLFDPRRG